MMTQQSHITFHQDCSVTTAFNADYCNNVINNCISFKEVQKANVMFCFFSSSLCKIHMFNYCQVKNNYKKGKPPTPTPPKYETE